jgi:cation diffusion facilitator family transporter
VNSKKTKNPNLIRDKRIRKVTWVGLLINIVLSFSKVICGMFGNSQAMIADGIHSFSDTLTDAAVIIGSYFWSKPPDSRHQYGHRRIETLTSFFISFVLITAGAGIGWKAIISIKEIHSGSPSSINLIVAAISIFSKEILYKWTYLEGKRLKSISLMSNAWHHRVDSLSSIPVFISLTGAVLWPEFYFLDHIGALFVSVLIFHTAVKILLQTINEFIDSGASENICSEIEKIVLNNPEISEICGIKTRYMGSNLQVNFTVLMDGKTTLYKTDEISDKIKNNLVKDGPGIDQIDIQFKPDQKNSKNGYEKEGAD